MKGIKMWNILKSVGEVIIVVVAATILWIGFFGGDVVILKLADGHSVVVRQVVIVKGDTPLSLQAAVNQMLRDSSFVNVQLNYVSVAHWNAILISHDVKVVE